MNTDKGKALRRSSPIILRMSVLRCCKAEFALFLSRFSFTNIYDSRDSRGSGRLSLYILSATSTRFTDLDITRVISAERSPPCKAGSRTRTGNLWFPKAIHEPLNYTLCRIRSLYTCSDNCCC